MDVKHTLLSDFQAMLSMVQPYVLDAHKLDASAVADCIRDVERRAMQAGVTVKMPGSGIASDDKKKIDMYLGQVHTSIKSVRDLGDSMLLADKNSQYFSARMADMSRSVQQGISLIKGMN
ncbi:hypothetical protein HYV86_04460 [Candidatus Woesearchaeota archaeon]|nr:hypothetical protein [Candidatus Woesearchaeota archaeon]